MLGREGQYDNTHSISCTQNRKLIKVEAILPRDFEDRVLSYPIEAVNRVPVVLSEILIGLQSGRIEDKEKHARCRWCFDMLV